MAKNVYLDYAAATPMDTKVVAAMRPYFVDDFYNPSADYRAAREVKSRLNQARSTIAYWLGARPNEIIFTAGGTEANNLAICGVMDQYPEAGILTSAIEHDSVKRPASAYRTRGIPITTDGRVNLTALENLISDEVVLVSIMLANNEIGVIQPLVRVALLLNRVRRERRRRGIDLPLWFHADACQAGNYLDLHVNRLGVDLMTINGGKIYGPKQSGALFVKQTVELKPIITGGGQERNLRSGTENVAADIGLATALDLAQSCREAEAGRLTALRDYFAREVESRFKSALVNGSRRFRLANNLHISFTGQDNEYLLIGLDQEGIMAASGSACSAGHNQSSHVLRALGLSDEEARSSLRFSLGRTTTKQDIDQTVKVLGKLLIL